MLPNSAIINRRVDKNKMSSGEMNHLSLFTVIELNSVRYIFAGDLANINIQFLKDEILDNCRFVKIPHHGSKDPIKLVDKIQQAQDHKMHSVTTTFGGKHPYDDVLNKYAQKSHAVYCTGRGNDQYGLVDIKYNVTMPSTYVVKLEGNAREVRSLSKLLLPAKIS